MKMVIALLDLMFTVSCAVFPVRSWQGECRAAPWGRAGKLGRCGFPCAPAYGSAVVAIRRRFYSGTKVPCFYREARCASFGFESIYFLVQSGERPISE